ncbi:hypothetical protein D3C73_981440 [compost metagenome]
MKELRPGEFWRLEAFFNRKKQHLPALSVLQEAYPGRVFVNQTGNPDLAVVWATGRWMYAAGNIELELNKAAVKRLLKDTVIPECNALNLGWFEIYTEGTEAWDQLFLSGLEGLQAGRHFESVYELQLEQFRQVEDAVPALPDDLQLEIGEYPVLEQTYFHLPYLRHDLLKQIAIGAAVKSGRRTLSVCKNNGFTVGNEYFVDVDTFEFAQRGQGYATQAARALIRYYLQQEMIPLWETTHENIASHRLASKLGFIPVEHYPVYSFRIHK